MNIIRILLILAIFNASVGKAADCNLSIGYLDYPPLTYNDNKGNVLGLDVELLDIIAKQANCKVTWLKLPWERVLAQLKSGEIMAATSAIETSERAVFANFVKYRPNSTKIFVRKEDLAKLQNINSFAELLEKTNFIIGVYNGYNYGAASEMMSDPKYKDRFSSIPDTIVVSNFSKLQANRIDATIMEEVVGVEALRANKLDDKIVSLSFEMNQNVSANIMISKAADPDNKYYHLLKASTEVVKDSAQYKEIMKKYYGQN